MSKPKPSKPDKPHEVWLLHRADGTRFGNSTYYDSAEDARHWAVSWFIDKTLVPVRYVPAKEKK